MYHFIHKYFSISKYSFLNIITMPFLKITILQLSEASIACKDNNYSLMQSNIHSVSNFLWLSSIFFTIDFFDSGPKQCTYVEVDWYVLLIFFHLYVLVFLFSFFSVHLWKKSVLSCKISHILDLTECSPPPMVSFNPVQVSLTY